MAASNTNLSTLMQAADQVRVGLAGSIRDYALTTYQDVSKKLSDIDYGGQSAGYVSQPGEVVNYVENHDNQTLFDINVYKLPVTTSREDRVRVQMLGVAITAFSQGVAYFHAGLETLRSKSMDGNSYDSGDWFNRLDWTFHDNYFATGVPPRGDNGSNYDLIKPLLRNAAVKPAGADIVLARNMFSDLLKIRASTTLLRLRTADDIKARLKFYNTGASQNPVLTVGHVDGAGYAGAGFKELIYFVNVDKTPHVLVLSAEEGSLTPCTQCIWPGMRLTNVWPPRHAMTRLLEASPSQPVRRWFMWSIDVYRSATTQNPGLTRLSSNQFSQEHR